MSEGGDLKDDVKLPDGEVGQKIRGLFDSDKETSKLQRLSKNFSWRN